MHLFKEEHQLFAQSFFEVVLPTEQNPFRDLKASLCTARNFVLAGELLQFFLVLHLPPSPPLLPVQDAADSAASAPAPADAGVVGSEVNEQLASLLSFFESLRVEVELQEGGGAQKEAGPPAHAPAAGSAADITLRHVGCSNELGLPNPPMVVPRPGSAQGAAVSARSPAPSDPACSIACYLAGHADKITITSGRTLACITEYTAAFPSKLVYRLEVPVPCPPRRRRDINLVVTVTPQCFGDPFQTSAVRLQQLLSPMNHERPTLPRHVYKTLEIHQPLHVSGASKYQHNNFLFNLHITNAHATQPVCLHSIFLNTANAVLTTPAAAAAARTPQHTPPQKISEEGMLQSLHSLRLRASTPEISALPDSKELSDSGERTTASSSFMGEVSFSRFLPRSTVRQHRSYSGTGPAYHTRKKSLDSATDAKKSFDGDKSASLRLSTDLGHARDPFSDSLAPKARAAQQCIPIPNFDSLFRVSFLGNTVPITLHSQEQHSVVVQVECLDGAYAFLAQHAGTQPPVVVADLTLLWSAPGLACPILSDLPLLCHCCPCNMLVSIDTPCPCPLLTPFVVAVTLTNLGGSAVSITSIVNLKNAVSEPAAEFDAPRSQPAAQQIEIAEVVTAEEESKDTAPTSLRRSITPSLRRTDRYSPAIRRARSTSNNGALQSRTSRTKFLMECSQAPTLPEEEEGEEATTGAAADSAQPHIMCIHNIVEVGEIPPGQSCTFHLKFIALVSGRFRIIGSDIDFVEGRHSQVFHLGDDIDLFVQ